MNKKNSDLIIGIGGAAGDGVASSGRGIALALARQGLAVYAYNSYQSVIRGGRSGAVRGDPDRVLRPPVRAPPPGHGGRHLAPSVEA